MLDLTVLLASVPDAQFEKGDVLGPLAEPERDEFLLLRWQEAAAKK
jgi:hypothetical protein